MGIEISQGGLISRVYSHVFGLVDHMHGGVGSRIGISKFQNSDCTATAVGITQALLDGFEMMAAGNRKALLKDFAIGTDALQHLQTALKPKRKNGAD